MHLIISWDIKAEEPDWASLNKKLKNCLKGYSWVKPLTTLYIVKIDSFEDRDEIRSALIEVCKGNRKKINLIISPTIEGDKYSGWLPKPMWEKIKKRTKGELYDFS